MVHICIIAYKYKCLNFFPVFVVHIRMQNAVINFAGSGAVFNTVK